jgi:hypothetical protein
MKEGNTSGQGIPLGDAEVFMKERSFMDFASATA